MGENINEFMSLINGWKYSTWTEPNFMYELPCKWEFSFVALEENKIRGFCVASNKISDAYYIHLIFLSPNCRGKDLGRGMIEQAKRIAGNYGLHRIELRCPESNNDSLAFYKRVGFTIKEILKDETSGDESDYYLIQNF